MYLCFGVQLRSARIQSAHLAGPIESDVPETKRRIQVPQGEIERGPPIDSAGSSYDGLDTLATTQTSLLQSGERSFKEICGRLKVHHGEPAE
jgi:hypothetical protein